MYYPPSKRRWIRESRESNRRIPELPVSKEHLFLLACIVVAGFFLGSTLFHGIQGVGISPSTSRYDQRTVPVYGEQSTNEKGVSKNTRLPASDWIHNWVHWLDSGIGLWEKILGAGLPMGAGSRVQSKMSTPTQESGSLVETLLTVITGAGSDNPRDILVAGLPILSNKITVTEIPTAKAPAVKPLKLPPIRLPSANEIAQPEPQGSRQPLVGIYHSHTGESYAPTSGRTYKPGVGDIVSVGREVATVLRQKYGIGVVFSAAVHDFPSQPAAYRNSRITGKRMLTRYPSIQVLLDIHRDSGPSRKLDMLTGKDGRNYVKLMEVVGTDALEAGSHPHWRRNLAFANSLHKILVKLQPGIVRRIDVRDKQHKPMRLNQDLLDHALLLEFGCDLNSLEEACNTADLVAQAIQIYLKQSGAIK